jgi:hypothetical protein
VHELIEAAGATEADATVENAARGMDSVTDSLLTAQGLLMYLVGRVDRLRAEQGEEWWQATLEVEFGGIGEAAYRLATLSRRNLTVHAMAVRLARAFVKRRFTEPLLRGHDSLGGLHANTHLPLLVSGARGAQVEAEAQALAQSLFDQFSMDFLTGEVTMDGNPKAVPGKTIQFDGFGKAFSGKYLITAATHTYRTEEGYRTTIAFARNVKGK